jgi:hypothetical protein
MYEDPKKWKSWLSQAEFWYNSSYHSSLGCSPFKALYGHEPNVGALPDTKEVASALVAEVIQELHDQAIVLKAHLAKAQNKMKHAADKKKAPSRIPSGRTCSFETATICTEFIGE